jgi:hypothetical protein
MSSTGVRLQRALFTPTEAPHLPVRDDVFHPSRAVASDILPYVRRTNDNGSFMPTTALSKTQFFMLAEVQELADDRTLERGEQHWHDGAVQNFAVDHAGRVIASVRGTPVHQVSLLFEPAAIEYSCTCRVGYDGGFCEHCVAVALRYIMGEPRPADGAPDVPGISADQLAGELATLDKEELIAILVDQAMKDEMILWTLRRAIDRKAGRKLDTTPYRQLIDRATSPRDLDYFEMVTVSTDLLEVINTISDLMADLHDQESVLATIDLVEYAVQRIERMLRTFGDFNGAITEVLASLVDIHLRACLIVRPDPIELAERLLALALEGAWEFDDAYVAYADVLGEPGRRHYRQLAEQKWKDVPENPSPRTSYDLERGGLTRILQTIGTVDGDAALLASVMVKNLHSLDSYLEAAQLLRASGRHDEALDVAERGLRRFRNHPALTEVLVDEYLLLGRKQEALDAAWNHFADVLDAGAFTLLKKSAKALRAWKSWKQKAVELLEERSAQQAEQSPEAAPPQFDFSSQLVEILLADGDDEAAWEAATTYGCRDDLWLRLAAARADRNPDDALAIYRAQIEEATRSVSWHAYERIVEMLRLMEPILRSQGRSDEFTAEVETLRETWSRRKNLMKMLDEAFPGGTKKAKR